ncbi:uncharacterized protein LOC123895141 [Trifolium pratense]|uniref:Uncharacterized protein n=1 Tax=Trifolium pratense TaxID=57577 RepID=A0ACB0KT63_TRIPR|nr:uncharacterized protein LOC123895141 [Trifolium pratense]CAJ2659766.1 unnamed protein product [Trifolium pratense]
MAKRFNFLVEYKELVKNFQSNTSPYRAAIVSNFSIAKQSHVHTQSGDPIVGAINQGSDKAREVLGSVEEVVGKESGDTAWDATKKTVQLVTNTTTAEADMNIVDTVEYRSSEDLSGQLGDGCDKIQL